MESSRDDKLAATLSALRPAPRPAFAAELDERAAAGFPRRGSSGGAPLGRLLTRLRAIRPRRLILPAGGVALAAVAVATVIVASSEPRTHLGSALDRSAGAAETSSSSAAAGGTAAAAPNGAHEVPENATEVPMRGAGSAAGSATSAESLSSAPSRRSGPYASHANHRDVERSAEMVLGAEPAEVGDDAAKVFEAVHVYDGIVLSSSIGNGSEADAGAEFELLIPSARLGDALAAFSGIAEVRSRHEATNDITAPTVTVGEQLQDSHAKIDGLLNELANAETETEREAVEAQLRSERRHAAVLKSQLTSLQRRANFSRVSLRIETGANSSGSGGGAWGVDDALGDAGHILAIAAGVAIVGLAILGPLALIGLLIWLADRARVRRGRERALG